MDASAPLSQPGRQFFRSGLSRYLLELAIVFAAYFVGGKIGLAIPFTTGNVSPVWPPAGIALAALLLAGYRIWPAIALAAFLVNFYTPIPHSAALALAAGNTLGPLVSARFLLQTPGFRCSLSRLPDVLRLIVIAAPVGPAISAAVGVSILFLVNVNPWSTFGRAWSMWWLGDAMGMLIVAPLLMTLVVALTRHRPNKRQATELASLLIASVIATQLIFHSRLPVGGGKDVLALALIPFVLWGAIRFQSAGVATVTFLISSVAVWETAKGFGPFVRSSSSENATLLQSFLTVISVSGLVLAAVISERAYLIRQQAKREAIEQSERRYRGILEAANEGIWILDSQFSTAFVNRRMAELLGYSIEEMLGKSLFEFVFDEDLARKRSDLKIRHASSQRLRARYRKKDGSELWAAISRTTTFDEDGMFSGVLKMVSDLSDQMRAERERQHALDTVLLLSRAVEQTADCVLISDCHGRIEYVNPAFEATTGYTSEEAMGKTLHLLEPDRTDANLHTRPSDALWTGEPFRGTLVNQKKSGELYLVEETITPIKDSDGKISHFVSVIKDVTEARKIREQQVQFRLAREVQERFYDAPAQLAGIDIAAAAHPAEQTGGDYFDVIQDQNDDLYVAIGDVSGHGLDSAIVMALTRAYVRSFITMGLDVAEILKRANGMLAVDLGNNRYVTVLLVLLDTRCGTLRYASAGHVPGFIMTNSGEVKAMLDSTGLPLGLFPNAEFESRELQLKFREILILCTDGAEETTTRDGVEFGCDRMLQYVRNHANDSAREIAEGIYQVARCFARDEAQHDDITSVILKMAPPPRP